MKTRKESVIDAGRNGVAGKRNVEISEGVLRTTLTRAEFGEALGMKEDDLFIERMFASVAKTHKDKISFGEFLDVVIKFASGNSKDQMEVIFNMCDRNKDGVVNKEEFSTFMRSLNAAAGVQLTEGAQGDLVDELLAKATQGGISVENLGKDDFNKLFSEFHRSSGSDGGRRPIGLHFKGVKQEIHAEENESLQSFAVEGSEERMSEKSLLPLKRLSAAVSALLSWLEDRRQHITVVSLFFLAILYVFVERYWHYQYEAEHGDGRRMMGAGVAIARGSAAAISLSFAVILLTVCRNVITFLRTTLLNQYLPFDSAIHFHKIVAFTALFFSILFRYVFAAPPVVDSVYHAFRVTHFLNIMLYIVTIAHGAPRLLESPKFIYFVIGPVIVYAVDRLITMYKNYPNLQMLEAEILPSSVIHIKFERPQRFTFLSGNWARIACPQLEGAAGVSLNQRHAFSIASAPQDRTLEMFIKAVGPWTCHLRQAIQVAKLNNTAYPMLHLDGPYGGGNQEWLNYEVSVLVAGGIGVTPYAAILSDLVQATSGSNFTTVACKKSFEWFVDVLRNVEQKDRCGVLDIHIFITQFFNKYDLRTTMLYICEKHFRGAAGRSMFTNLKAANHFGRPKFDRFLKYVQATHNEQKKIGVFSCGPAPMNRNLHDACKVANRNLSRPQIVHRFETF